MAADDCYLLQVQMLVDSRKCTINFHFRQTGGADDINNATDLTNAFDVEIVPTLLLCLSEKVQLTCLYAHRICGPGPVDPFDPIKKPGIPNELQYIDTKIGLVTGDPLPANHGPVLKILQETTGGKHNGRIYMPGIAEAATTDGLLNPGFVVTPWTVLATLLQTTITSVLPPLAQFGLVVLSRVLNGVKRDVPVDFLVTDILVPSTLKNQRRRTTKKTGFATSPP